MKVLFIHQNFPGQFKHLAPALVKQGHTVVALTLNKKAEQQWRGVTLQPYSISRGSTPGIHPWVADIETKVIRGEACFVACQQLKQQGFMPDVVIAHSGWGESLFVKTVWPTAKLGVYSEFFYLTQGADVDFDPEFSTPSGDCRIQLKNTVAKS